MLFISAATGMSDLIDRYWQTHKLHYNASVQLAAAERVREFMANPEFAISSPDVSLQPPAKTPICLVATYDGQTEDFPEYATVLVDSVTRNAPYADLKIFVHNTTKESFPLTLQRPNVKIVDVGQIDASYVYRGFPGLATDKLCKLMGKGSPTDPALGWADQDVECELLERRLRDFAGNGGRAIEQLRGHWGNIFQDWISPERCDSWGWLDTSTAVGDLKRWMDNPLIRDADILTAHEGDDWRLYLRNSFTVHNYRKSPEVVSNLWKRCSSIATIPALLETFQRADDWLSITEGCYSYGAISQPSVKTVLAPWQLPSWADTRLLILNDGHANYCVGENNGEICRGWVRGFMEESKKKEQKQIAADRAARIAGERIPSEGTYHRVANDIFSHPPMSDVEETLAPPSIQCAPWLPLEYNLCLDKPEHKPTEKGSTYVQVIKTDSTGTTSISCLSYTLPSDGVGMEVVAGSRGVGETLIVKFLDWATKPPSESRTKKDRLDLKIERTWFYTSKSGSIQISPGKIMMHTMKGWW
ncbi:hypothetical protein DFJ77DRAFT_162141 [Powellomyces hirtus]|nr:hypothetical protein DFJ77DRAFT_162141 [Powellomyces hirtus]